MIVGHKKIIEDLKHLADGKQLSHGYIFVGPSMVGKKLVARSFAGYLENGLFEERSLLSDAMVIAPDNKGTLGIDSVRTLKNFLWQTPNVSVRRIAIIDGGEFLTTEAQNALLKITEEPPASSLLILITSDIDSLLPTVSSRLQKIYFPIISSKLIEDWLVGACGATKKAAADAVLWSFGKPGFAHALIHDANFKETLESAESLLKLQSEKRRDFIKKLLDDESFNFTKFMDALIINLATGKINKKEDAARWHKFLALRREIAYFNLNPRLQLESLLS